MAVYLLISAAVMLACVLLHRVTNKLGMPMLLAFILLGMFFGSDGIVKIAFDDFAFAEQICSVALIFIMFYGGFGTNWSEARPVAGKAVLLSSMGVVLTSGLTGVLCHFALGFDWLESMLVGAVTGSTDAASVFSILRSRKLSLKYNTASLLEVESGSNDPFSYMLTAIVLALMKGEASGGAMAYMIFAQVAYGAAFGVVIAIAAAWLMKRVRTLSAGFDAVLVVAIALLAYAAPAALGGNGYLSAYIAGIILGNSDIRHKDSLVPFFDGMTGIMQIVIFFLLGLLSFPSRLGAVALPALVIALLITFVARPVAVYAILRPLGCGRRQRLVVSWAGLRGAASIVFTVMACMAVTTKSDIFHIVFCIVLFSILIQGSLLPLVSKKLGMIDEAGDVMKTFTDYSDETPVSFVECTIPPGHIWHGRAVRDIVFPPETIVALLQRGGERIAPCGDTVLREGDKLVLSARTPASIDGVNLSERRIESGGKWVGSTIAEATQGHDVLVVMIIRGTHIVIPNGRTVLEAGDLLVLNYPENN